MRVFLLQDFLFFAFFDNFFRIFAFNVSFCWSDVKKAQLVGKKKTDRNIVSYYFCIKHTIHISSNYNFFITFNCAFRYIYLICIVLMRFYLRIKKKSFVFIVVIAITRYLYPHQKTIIWKMLSPLLNAGQLKNMQ